MACQSVISGTFKNISWAKAREPGVTPYGSSNGGLHGMHCSGQCIMPLAWVILCGGLACTSVLCTLCIVLRLSCASVLSTLCIVWYYLALVFLAHYVLFEISLTNLEALSLQVNALNSTCLPWTLTWHDSTKPDILNIILPVGGVKIDGNFFPHQSDTNAWDDDGVGSTYHAYFFSPGCLITWWNHLIVWTTFNWENAIVPIGLIKIFL